MIISIEILERTIYAHLVNAVVAAGYMPDRVTKNTPELYSTALLSIKANKGFTIAVKGIGSPLDKEGHDNMKFVLIRKNGRRGDLGSDNTTYFDKVKNLNADDVFDKYMRNGTSRDFPFEIRTIGNIQGGQRVMEQIVYNVFGSNKYLTLLSAPNDSKTFDDTKRFLFIANGDYDLTRGQITERIYLYTAKDIFVEPDTKIGSEIPPLVEVSTGIGSTGIGSTGIGTTKIGSGIGVVKDLKNITQADIDNLVPYSKFPE